MVKLWIINVLLLGLLWIKMTFLDLYLNNSKCWVVSRPELIYCCDYRFPSGFTAYVNMHSRTQRAAVPKKCKSTAIETRMQINIIVAVAATHLNQFGELPNFPCFRSVKSIRCKISYFTIADISSSLLKKPARMFTHESVFQYVYHMSLWFF